MNRASTKLFLQVTAILLVSQIAMADVGGKVTGTKKDQTDAAVDDATVTAVNTATGVRQTTKTDAQGLYSFPVLFCGEGIPSRSGSRGQANGALKDRIILRYAGSHYVLVRHQPEVRNVGSHQTTKTKSSSSNAEVHRSSLSARDVTLFTPARESFP